MVFFFQFLLIKINTFIYFNTNNPNKKFNKIKFKNNYFSKDICMEAILCQKYIYKKKKNLIQIKLDFLIHNYEF